jgi:hypothetical protein
LVRIELSEKETEVLALSLLDQRTYSFDSIRSLYDRRWGVIQMQLSLAENSHEIREKRDQGKKPIFNINQHGKINIFLFS